MNDFRVDVGAKGIKLDPAVCRYIASQPSAGAAGEQLSVLLAICQAQNTLIGDALDLLQKGDPGPAKERLLIAQSLVAHTDWNP